MLDWRSLAIYREYALKYHIVPVTPFEQNATVLWCEETRAAAVIDPGGDIDRIIAVLEEESITLEKILVTHGHVDHAGGVAALKARFPVPVEGPQEEDLFWLEMMPTQAARYGFPAVESFVPDRWLNQGDTVSVGKLSLEVLHCPGHTPGHVCFYHRPTQQAWVGDVLFAGSVGRTDFPRGNMDTLVASIRTRLFPLGDEVTFTPGHGPQSTFGRERRFNPYVGD